LENLADIFPPCAVELDTPDRRPSAHVASALRKMVK
jgi:hypothetical protein